MMHSRRQLIIAAMIPIVFLLFILFKSHSDLIFGQRVVLPVEGFDPRDLLSGQYISYRVNYDVPAICGPRKPNYLKPPESFICLKPKFFSHEQPSRKRCQLYIKGRCQYGRFLAGIERFYLPEEAAVKVEQLIPYHKSSIEVSVSRNGTAVVNEFMIDGKPWDRFLKTLKQEKKP